MCVCPCLRVCVWLVVFKQGSCLREPPSLGDAIGQIEFLIETAVTHQSGFYLGLAFLIFHLLKNIFSPVGFKGNLSLLDIF